MTILVFLTINKETIQQLFFNFHVARFVWIVLQVAFYLIMEHFLDVWLQKVNHTLQSQVRVIESAILCSIWRSRNNAIFDN